MKIAFSPTGADGKIHFINHRGELFVVAATEEFKLVRVIPMDEAGNDLVPSTIAPANGNRFIRTGGRLYCVGN